MTNKECVKHLNKLKIGIAFINTFIQNDTDKDTIDLEALDHAIKVLEGEENDKYCHNCKHIKRADKAEDRCKYALTECPYNKEHWEAKNE